MIEPRVIDVKDSAKDNTFFRKVLFTAPQSQLVIMSLLPDEDIGAEVHDGDQLIYAVKGEGVAVIGGKRMPLAKGAILCVPAGAMHNVINTGTDQLKLFTIYAPPQHAADTVHATKAEAAAEEQSSSAEGLAKV